MWALVGKLIALVAIPHAAAQGLAKLVAISNRPRFVVVAKTMDAATYVALALVSADVVHNYLVAAPRNLSSADIEEARRAITLGSAIGVYALVYCLVLAGLAAVLKWANTVLSTTDRKVVRSSLGKIAAVLFPAWNFALYPIGRAINQHPADGPVLAALVLFGPPLLGVLAIWGARIWLQALPTPAPAADATD
ncbi:hypothetical protein AWC31_00950 [Mycolicibacterium wolinskyi]|uniref:Uncharacterized protein n=2 Tax=Mycolicibacterium TaxID=1866885 RepID=A0A1X2FC07_9MYCO|nr:hypothetical protein AWC31_00950 [Mycolicibacterium wolinskyi]